MNIKEYKDRIAAILRRGDIAAAGVAAELAAHCVLVVSESNSGDPATLDAIERLEKMAGIEVNQDGEYVLTETFE